MDTDKPDELTKELTQDPAMTALTATVGTLVLAVAGWLLVLGWHLALPAPWGWLTGDQAAGLGLLALFLFALAAYGLRIIEARRSRRPLPLVRPPQ